MTRTNRGIATLEQSLRLCTAMAFGDPRKLFDEHNNCKPVAELSKVQALMVAGFEVEETFTKVGDKAEHTGYVKRFRMADRAPYVNMLLKFHGAFPSSKQPLPGPKDVTPRFDPKNLTPEEWEQAKAARNAIAKSLQPKTNWATDLTAQERALMRWADEDTNGED